MGDLELHPSHTGVHAAGILVCNEPITDYCTVGADGVPHIDKPDSEYLNLLKIDALGLRTLGIIGDTGVITAEELYSLKFDDEAVFSILNDDKVSGIFQFEGDAVRSVTRSVHIDRFSKIDNLTALARPGPLCVWYGSKIHSACKG
ncbi:DNA polymerase III subunit alpha [Serratia phage KKP 3709]|nr:DNA polymerase III subunit alpha [Serratia phage KKP 3709]